MSSSRGEKRRRKRLRAVLRQSAAASRRCWSETESQLEQLLGQAIVYIREEGEGILVRVEFLCNVDEKQVTDKIRDFLSRNVTEIPSPCRIKIVRCK